MRVLDIGNSILERKDVKEKIKNMKLKSKVSTTHGNKAKGESEKYGL